MRTLFAVLSLFFLFSFNKYAASAPARTVIVGGDHNNPPYEFLENGKPSGFNIDLITAVAETAGFEIDIRLAPWSVVRNQIGKGEIDLLSGMCYSDDRSREVDFTIPHTMVNPGIFVRKGSDIRSFDDLRGRQIIVQERDIIHDILEKDLIASKIIAVINPEEEIRLLASGNYDCAFMFSMLQGQHFIRSLGLDNIVVINPGLPQFRYGFAVSKNSSELVLRVNEALSILKLNGKYGEIYEKWFGIYEKQEIWDIIKFFIFAIVVVFLFFLISLVWSWSLKRKVRVSTAELRKAHDELERRVEERTAALREVNERLISSESEKSLILDSIFDLAVFQDPEMNILWANKAAGDSVGVNPSDLKGRRCWEVWHQRREPCDGCPVLRARESGESEKNEICSPDGRVWFIRAYPVKDQTGTLLGLAEFALDITESKKAEVLRLESERKYRELVQNANSIIFRMDRNGRFTFFNEFAQEFFGFSENDILGRNILGTILPEKDTAGRDLSSLVTDIINNSDKYVNNENENMLRSGRRVWIAWTNKAIRDDSGNISEILCVGNDITERIKADELLERKTLELERSNEELEHFASIVSHDLKSPLASIGGYARVLASRYSERFDESGKKMISHIVDGVQRMELLVYDLLEYARVSSNDQTFSEIECSSVVEMALSNLRNEIEQKGAIVTSDDLPVIYGDEMQFVQLFQNLIGNGIKYRSERQPRIHISARRIDGKTGIFFQAGGLSEIKKGWLFAVEDNGIGIENGEINRIFEIFTRLHTQDKYPGTGIGLAICKRIVERHGGHIWVESAVGKGSLFYFAIPYDHNEHK